MAMGIAQSPAKTLAMQGFMMYMTGSSVSIISIMVVGMSLLNSGKALLATNQCKYKHACSFKEEKIMMMACLDEFSNNIIIEEATFLIA